MSQIIKPLICKYIYQLLIEAKLNGLTEITLRAGDIHNSLNLYKRLPSCCNAMRSIEGYRFVEIDNPPEGDGCNVYIKYFLD
ncbi:hypothetical protein SAMN02746066_03393 [Anaerosporobacter mobilis DSM 15930]|jgi:hypothetical protein|uniref:TusA-related sulfurtransferase n=1 Tax=Anaerosporobacter mobilis DSM 15930 TaxID=1120996 RepID=A0A1M7LV10_9FIRM|nr:hypothetical protein [Anaerosporobacter mobilis]SHM81585.1 hypothetical protein SAMN02746066_03393 [Anaerosporobacter mobilis DSM 15930]